MGIVMGVVVEVMPWSDGNDCDACDPPPPVGAGVPTAGPSADFVAAFPFAAFPFVIGGEDSVVRVSVE